MRKLYLLVLLVFISFTSFSQNELYKEDFELPSEADSIISTGNPGWNINTTLAYEGVQSYHTSIVQMDTSYAKTISFTTTGNSFVILSFAHIAKISFFDAGILEISTDNVNWTKITSTNSTYLGSGNFNTGTGDKFTAVAYSVWDPANDAAVPNNTWWRLETFDISNLAANQPQVWLRFKAYDGNNDGSAGNFGWLIDDILINGFACDPSLTSGTASASNDSICNLTPVTLTLTGSYGDIQWLVSTDGGQTWLPATGPGSNTDEYEVTPLQSSLYAAVTSLGACVSDTSNVVSLVVEQVVAPTTTGASRCGIGNITLSASGNGTLNWYDAQTGGNLLNTGTTFTTFINTTTTFYVESIVGTAPVEDSLQVHPFVGGNGCGGGNMFDVNPLVDLTVDQLDVHLSAAAGTNVLVTLYYKTGTYVGSETNSADWILFDTVSIVSAGPNNPSIMQLSTGLNLTGGQAYAFFVNANVNYTNVPTPANYSNADLTVTTGIGLCSAFGGTNPGRAWNGVIHYTKGGGCPSPRTPVDAIVNPAPAISISASSSSLCEGDSSSLTVTSSNTGYTYTWSPNIGLNDTLGNSVIATPLSPITYYVVGNDGTCGNIDSIFIDVGPAAIAGTAISPADTVCTGNSTTLSLMGSAGNIQWQSSPDGINWQNETGPGSNANQFTITPLVNTYYQAILSSAGCPEDTTNILFVTSLSPTAPTATGATRCGIGPVSLQASGNGTLYWYADSSSSNFLQTGPSYNPTVTTTTTYYVANVVGSAGGASSILITEADLGGTDGLEIMNVTSSPVDVTGWTVAISDSYTDINDVNTTVKTLSGVMNPGDIMHWTDGTINPWGSNMFWNPGAFPTFTGWAIIIDNFGNIVDFVIWEWPDANIQGMNITVAGFPITIGSEWSGNGIGAAGATAGVSLSRIGNSDNNDLADFNIQTTSLGVANPGLNTPFSGGGCSSPRIPVDVIVTPPPAISVSASSTSICLGDTVTLIASSPNSGYVYTWSPPAGLSSTTGDTVYASPTVPTTYVVFADDGTCGNMDSVFINYGVSAAANPLTTGDTICGPGVANLSAQGSGNLYWFDVMAGGIPVGTGGTYSPNLMQTDTFYVQALVGGDYFNIGPVNSGFGNQSSINTANWGMTFDVNTTSTLDRVYIYPWATGSVTINMLDASNNVLQTTTVNVTAFTGKTAVDLGWQLIPGTGYKLALGSGSVALGRNTTNASYPYTVAGGPLSITGYFNPNPGTAPNTYLYFYDWLVSTGCKSNRVPVTGVVLSLPPVPTISQVGNSLVSSSAVNYQWYFQGNPIPGATSQTYTPTQQGQYHVLVGNSTCFQLSNTLFFIPIGINENEYIALSVYPNPGNGVFNIEFASLEGRDADILIYNLIGELIFSEQVEKLSGFYKTSVDLSDYSNGMYVLMIKCNESKYFQKLILSK